ncbi:MAG: cupin domain-containing protein [Pseudomonadota bacterium]
MKKVIAMIPARLGSKRIKSKNLRLLSGKPLISYVIDKCKQAKVFDEIYINSEADVFNDIADEYDIKFYKRDEFLASDDATNDMFVLDFITNIKCEFLVQVNPTSPLITVEDIKAFVDKMLKEDLDTLHSVKKEQIEALYDNKPLNFDPMKQMPRSQDLKPAMLFSSGIMGWNTRKYFENMKRLGSATYGGDGKTDYFILEGFSKIDIDNEEDFELAEIAIDYLEIERGKNIEYYKTMKDRNKHIEWDVPSILAKDGVTENDLDNANMEVINITKIIAEKRKESSWSKRVINTSSNSATLICQMPNEGNRMHYHSNWNEWWFIVDGKWNFEIEGKSIIVSTGDFVFIEKGKLHKITAIGDKPAIRLAVSREDVAHIYP